MEGGKGRGEEGEEGRGKEGEGHKVEECVKSEEGRSNLTSSKILRLVGMGGRGKSMSPP